jgi:predicted GNAT superfamily acetyltransferase
MSALRPCAPGDLDWMLALNAANVVETSPLDHDALTRLIAQCVYAKVDEGRAFLLALDQAGDYESVNYQWFRARHPRFLYLDRIVVAASARGAGLARALYEDMFAFARAGAYPLACCEVNVAPPNPASDAFHARFGFTEQGRADLASGKTVRYLTRAIG